MCWDSVVFTGLDVTGEGRIKVESILHDFRQSDDSLVPLVRQSDDSLVPGNENFLSPRTQGEPGNEASLMVGWAVGEAPADHKLSF